MSEEKDWLDDLKIGDLVCYHSCYHGYVFETILKITPTKQIKTKQHTFKNGYCRLGDWDSINLQPITQKILDEVERKKLLGEVNEFRFEKLNLEQIKWINTLIKDFDRPKGNDSTASHNEVKAEGGS